MTDEQPRTDPLIDEVRARRAALLARHGNDLRSLLESIRRLQESHPHLVMEARRGKRAR
jgi:hypothetical protein